MFWSNIFFQNTNLEQKKIRGSKNV